MEEKSIMTDLNATLSRSISPAFMEVSGSSFAEEDCTDTNAYWEALLLRKTAQTPMLTGKLFCSGRLHRHQCLLGSFSAEEDCTDTNAYWKTL